MSVAYGTEVTGREAEKAPGSGQCQVFTAVRDLLASEFPRWQELVDRCPNRALALIWYSCPNDHQYPEEVCAGHISPPGAQWCGACGLDGLTVEITVTFIGWI